MLIILTAAPQILDDIVNKQHPKYKHTTHVKLHA